MIIRSATNSDCPQVQELVRSVLDEHGLAFDAGQTDADLADIVGRYLTRGGLFEVVENEDREIVGTAGLYPLSDGDCELRKMYLAKSVCGQGLGKLLLDRLIQAARDRGFKRVVLETSSKLPAAISLYRKYGFVPFCAAHMSTRCDQAWELHLDADSLSI